MQAGDAGLDSMHGLRCAHALARYEETAGWKAPARGRPAAALAVAGAPAHRHGGAADDPRRAGARSN